MENQDTNPDDQKAELTEYERGWFESLSTYEKGLLVSATIAGLYWVSFYSGWITEKSVEFFVGTLISFVLFLVVAVQFYISKRQWHVMSQQESRMREQHQAMLNGLEKTQSLLEQNKEIVAAMQAQVDLAEDALRQSDEVLEFNQSSFYRAERAYLAIRNVRPNFHAPGQTQRKWQLVIDADPRFAFDIVNGGRTPAFAVTAMVFTAIGEVADKVPEWTQSPAHYITDFILPNETGTFISRGNATPDDNWDDIWHGGGDLYYFVKIVIDYMDIGSGSKLRRSTYIFRYNEEWGMVLDRVDDDEDAAAER